MFTTPAGTPASTMSSAKSSAVRGVSSEGFKTQVFPAAKAGASFHDVINIGKFQGTIWPQTPIGSRTTKLSELAGTCMVSPWILVAMPA